MQTLCCNFSFHASMNVFLKTVTIFRQATKRERMRRGEIEKTRHNSSLPMVTLDRNMETSEDLGRAEVDEEERPAESMKAEFTHSSRKFQT